MLKKTIKTLKLKKWQTKKGLSFLFCEPFEIDNNKKMNYNQVFSKDDGV